MGQLTLNAAVHVSKFFSSSVFSLIFSDRQELLMEVLLHLHLPPPLLPLLHHQNIQVCQIQVPIYMWYKLATPATSPEHSGQSPFHGSG